MSENEPPTYYTTDEDVRPDANVTHELFFDVLEKEIQKVHNFTDRKVSEREQAGKEGWVGYVWLVGKWLGGCGSRGFQESTDSDLSYHRCWLGR